jgi:hypothetical protein
MKRLEDPSDPVPSTYRQKCKAAELLCSTPESSFSIENYSGSSIRPWLADNWSIQTVFRNTRVKTCSGQGR